MSSGGQTSTTTSNSNPWGGQQTYLSDIFKQAQTNYNSSSPQYFPGSTVANQSPATQAGISGTIARATNGSPLNQAAGGWIQQALGANGSPGLDPVFQNVQNHVLPGVESQFSQAGRYGSGAQATAATNALTQAYAPYALQNSQFAVNQAPQIANQDYTDLNALAGAGQTQDAHAQQLLNDQINRFNFNTNLPANKLAQYSGIVQGGNWGTQGTSTQTQPSGGLGGFLGGALGGLL